MKIVVIGHLCLDVIHLADGRETRSYGGIFFSVATLANLLGPSDTVQPVFGVGRTDYPALIDRLSRYENLDHSGIFKIDGPSNHVELVYSSQTERTERSTNIAEPIPWKRIKPFVADADMVLLNMISGFDVTLETLDEIRMAVRERLTPVYMDVHSLTLGLTGDSVRFHRPVEAWRRWLFMLHGAQMNEEEAAVLSRQRLDEESLARHVLSLQTKAMVITRGARGCTAFIDGNKRIQRVDRPGIEPEKAVDPTGCGDVFAASYCAHYARNRSVEGAVQFANSVASFKARFPGSTEIDRVSEFRELEPVGGAP